jgi:hypothetical protein
MTTSFPVTKTGPRLGLAAVTGFIAMALLAGQPSALKNPTPCSPRLTAPKSVKAT